MSCNFLGALLDKLCDSYFCSIDTICNCAEYHTVVIGNPNDPAVEKIIQASKNHQSLSAAISAARKDSTQLAPVPLHARSISRSDLRSRDPQIQTDARAAILGSAIHCCNMLTQSGGNLPEEECMARVIAATHLTRIHDRYVQGIPISQSQIEKLNATAIKIQHYGSAAAGIWQILKDFQCSNKNDLNLLTIAGKITRSQRKILAEIFDKKNKGCLMPDTFGQLEARCQAIFLSAAEKGLLNEQPQTFIPWTKLPSDSESSPPTIPEELPSSSKPPVVVEGRSVVSSSASQKDLTTDGSQSSVTPFMSPRTSREERLFMSSPIQRYINNSPKPTTVKSYRSPLSPLSQPQDHWEQSSQSSKGPIKHDGNITMQLKNSVAYIQAHGPVTVFQDPKSRVIAHPNAATPPKTPT
jgi:hypothetical protein